MKRAYRVLVLLLLLFLAGCTSSNERAVNDLTSVLRSPELRSLPLEGIWQVTRIITRDKNDKTETNKSANVGNSVDTRKSNGVNTSAQTALGFYALSGVLGLAGVAFTGKHARKED